MKGKCCARITSNLSKYKMEMFLERELSGAPIQASYNLSNNAFIISVEKDNSGYNDRSSITILLEPKDAEALAWEILKGLNIPVKEQSQDTNND